VPRIASPAGPSAFCSFVRASCESGEEARVRYVDQNFISDAFVGVVVGKTALESTLLHSHDGIALRSNEGFSNR
jgi:hypothetical protein